MNIGLFSVLLRTDSLPALDEAVKTIKVKNPITQEFSGMHGTFTQANIEKQRSYNLPQWKSLTEETQHQPPARRGERRKMTEKPTRAAPRPRPTPAADSEEPPKKRRPGRPRRHPPVQEKSPVDDEPQHETDGHPFQAPPTPTSPNTKPEPAPKQKGRAKRSTPGRPKGSQAKSITERRKYNQASAAEEIDHAAFEGFDYRFHGNDEFTKERCAELENLYWKSLTFAPPMYGADMPGSLFEESCDTWNVAKLPNILDVLGQKVPGVNTAYLYLGMWKATFAWHLEDVDLYSINYIHFGAPKQWYSISQADARQFEKVMRDVWPTDSKNCSQFLRHKTYLISPNLLKEKGITVNRLVHNEGEFVITFPYGYHSGYNLGYNCAESVNFATEAWLDYGKIAKKCECEADSVWIDVYDIERKLRGEPTPEYYEETDEEDVDEETGLPSPTPSVSGRGKLQGAKKRRGPTVAPKKVKKIKIRIKQNRNEPCCLCPNDMPFYPLLPTDTGKQAHELCALYTKETSVDQDDSGKKVIRGVNSIDKARLELKCNLCRSKKGACFQCTEKKCCRAYHATCAAAAGVRIDFGPTPVLYTEEGMEYFQELFDFRCRFHRNKRPNWKAFNPEPLESSKIIRRYMDKIQPGDVVQAQLLTNLGPEQKRLLGDIFAGAVIEKRPEEQTVLLELLPEGDRFEVEYKWILAPDLEESKQLKPSPNAKLLPPELEAKTEGDQGYAHGPPRADDVFTEGCKWAEFISEYIPKNPHQVKTDLQKPNQFWYYIGNQSTDSRASFTEDPRKKRANAAANFMDTVRPRYIPPLNPAIHGTASIGNQAHLVRPYPSQNVQGSGSPRPPLTSKPQPLQGRSQNLASVSDQSANASRISINTSPGTGYYSAQKPNSYLSTPSQNGGLGQTSQSSTMPKPQHSPSSGQHSRLASSGAQQTQRRPSNSTMSPPIGSQTGAGVSMVNGRLQARPSSSSSQSSVPMMNTMSPPTTARSPSSATSAFRSEYSPFIDYVEHLKKYPYLRESWIRRPKTYTSPYDASTKSGLPERSQATAKPVGEADVGIPGRLTQNTGQKHGPEATASSTLSSRAT